MKVPNHMQNNAFFIGIMDGDTFIAKGTGFFATILEGETRFVYLVTAGHVINGIHHVDKEKIFIRVNAETGAKVYEVKYENWKFHPDTTVTTDVAAAWFNLPDLDVKFLAVDTSLFLTKAKLTHHEVSAGDQIFIIGLLINHYGKEKNLPIIRIGSIAAFPDEPVKTRLGDTDCILVEALSIGGLSGSPVWHHANPVRVQLGKLQIRTDDNLYHLAGLIHGHFTEAQDNTGIAIVIPAERILETLNHPDFIGHRQRKETSKP